MSYSDASGAIEILNFLLLAIMARAAYTSFPTFNFHFQNTKNCLFRQVSVKCRLMYPFRAQLSSQISPSR